MLWVLESYGEVMSLLWAYVCSVDICTFLKQLQKSITHCFSTVHDTAGINNPL